MLSIARKTANIFLTPCCVQSVALSLASIKETTDIPSGNEFQNVLSMNDDILICRKIMSTMEEMCLTSCLV